MTAAPDSDRLTKALALLEQLEPGAPDKVTANLDAFHPEAAEILLGFAFTDVVARDGIDLKTREMLTVAMLSALGTAPGQLEFHIRAAMNNGVSRLEIVEIILQASVYAGVPAAMNAVAEAKKAFATTSQQHRSTEKSI